MDIQPSDEQRRIIAARHADPTAPLKIIAFAGTGKTTTLEMLAAAEGRPALYLAFNKAIQLEASRRFPGNVTCRTTHSLAFRAMGMSRQKHRLDRRLMGSDVARMLALPALDRTRPSQWGQWMIATVRRFCISADPTIGPQHLRDLPRDCRRADFIVEHARKLWTRISDSHDDVPFEHDAYLKMWQLDGARFPAGIDVLYLDEAQDTNPVTVDIVQRQRIPLVYVGDPWQSIYAFRGACNAMHEFIAPELHLSQSWRFGPVLAQIAGAVLYHASRRPGVPIRGNPDIQTAIGEILPADGRHAILCRTNASVFAEAIEGQDRIHIVGGGEPLIKLIRGGWALFNGDEVLDPPILARFACWDDLMDYVQESHDPELRLLTKIILNYRACIPRLVDSLRRRLVNDPDRADRVLSTAHRAKGLEFPAVRLADDFPTLEDLNAVDERNRPRLTPQERDQELNLLYVAATRARYKLEPNAAVRSCVAAWRAIRQDRAA